MLWIPGPTYVRPEIFEELQRPMIGHRSAAMRALLERIDPGLRLAFGLGVDSTATVGVGTHSATAMMEGALHGAGQRVLAVVNGAFSRRWAGIARTLGKDVTELEIAWGDAVDQPRLATALAAGPFDAVTLVVNETSTGVFTPLAPVARALSKHRNTHLLVDVVSAIAGAPIGFDEHRVDFALAGVNKALALPPGITVMCASERYLERARSVEKRSWYLDPVRTLEGHVARKTPTTPCIPLYAALARQLEDITESEGWQERFARHARMSETTLAWAAKHGLGPFPATKLSSPTVSCLRAEGIDAAGLVAGLLERGLEIGAGYGDLKGLTFRIGHMGDHTERGLEQLLAQADEVLAG